MMFADRVKQTALVTGYASSVFTINLDSGAALTGFKTFRNGFSVPDTTAQPGVISGVLIPVIIENGALWMSGIGVFNRDGSGALGNLTLTFDLNDFATQKSDGAAITNGSTVTIYAGSNAGHASGVRAKSNVAGSFNTSYLGVEGEVCAGRVSQAIGKHSVAVGNTAQVNGAYSAAIGSSVSGSRQCVHARGYGVADYGPHCDNFGLHLDPKTVGGYGTIDTYLWNENSLRSQVTTNATPAKVCAFDIDAPDTPLAISDDFYCDSGISVFLATVTAFEPATDVTKVWKLEFAVKTKLDFSASAFVGTQVKTVVGTDAGSASWDIAAVLVGASEYVAIEVTGEAAKDIFWTASVKAHRNVIY